jgi:hypothetical protein
MSVAQGKGGVFFAQFEILFSNTLVVTIPYLVFKAAVTFSTLLASTSGSRPLISGLCG